MHFNIDSITAEGRLEQLEVVCQTLKVDILIITESKLDESIPNSMIEINKFHEPLRRDRNRHGGGCLIYISENLTFKQMSELQSDKYDISGQTLKSTRKCILSTHSIDLQLIIQMKNMTNSWLNLRRCSTS